MSRVDWTADEIILVADVLRQRGWRRGIREYEPEAVELSELLRAAPIHPIEARGDRFRSPSSVQRKSFDLLSSRPDYDGKPTKGGAADRRVLDRWAGDPEGLAQAARQVRKLIREGALGTPEVQALELISDDIAEAPEGRLILAQHLRRERNPKLRRSKIATVLEHGESLRCEVCRFDFALTYGELGDGYIEVHHVRPLHDSGPTTTALTDLALLCSNCHRMIHRKQPWLTPAELTRQVKHL